MRRLHLFLTNGAGFIPLMLLPPMLVLAVVMGMPLLQAAYLSLQNAIITRPQANAFIGLANYAKMIEDPDVWRSLGTSLIYMVGSVSGAVAVGLGCALLTRRLFAGVGLVRLLMILPWSVPTVAAAMVFGVMYDTDFGIINQLLRDFFPNYRNIEWLLGRNTTMISLIIVEVWNQFPIAYVFLLAGLQQIQDELYESSQIDGANAFQQLIYITLPQLRYVLSVTSLLLSISAFKAFAVIFVLTQGGPAGRTETLVMKTYLEAFRDLDFGYSSALGVTAVLISFIMVFLFFRLTVANNPAESAA